MFTVIIKLLRLQSFCADMKSVYLFIYLFVSNCLKQYLIDIVIYISLISFNI